MSFTILFALGIITALGIYLLGKKYRSFFDPLLTSISCRLPIFAALVGLCMSFLVYLLFPPVSHTTPYNTLVVGTTPDFPPFTFVQNGKPAGFDIDLMYEIGQRMNKSIEIRTMNFNASLPSLQMGNIDVLASGLTATPERAQRVLFTNPYVEGNPLIIISLPKEPIQTVSDLVNKEVVVNQGYTADFYLSAVQGVHLKRLQTVADAFLALKSGRVTAFVTAQNTVTPFFEHYSSDQFYIATIPATDETASLAVTPKKPELLREIQMVLDSMKEDGTLEQLKQTWGV